MWKSANFVCEPKVDGSRYLMHVGVGGNRFTSRHISKKTGSFTEKTDNIPHLRDYFVNENLDVELEGCVFDGEIVRGNLLSKSSEVTKIMGALPKKAIQLQNELGYVDYYVFDLLFDRGNDIRNQPYEVRRNLLLDRLESLADPNKHLNIIPVKYTDKEEFFRDIIEAGGEGVILKDAQASYGNGWAKVKRKATFDVIILDYEEPTKITKKVSGEESISRFYENGWIGAIKFGQYYNGRLTEFGSCSGMDDATREDLSRNKVENIGRVIEIECQERTKTGRFRHPRFIRFRYDKKAEDCIYRPNEN
jgi:ATP-dependent DNA ligase